MKKLLAYMQLLRLPNVFTAMADIFMGFLISHGSLEPWREFALLLLASSSIYLAGMVLNDWFDIEVDRVERPQRPLPSGRVPRSHAVYLGIALLIIGFGAAMFVGHTSWIIALILIAAAVLYDGFTKNTLVGPANMGLCRALNVLLGMSSVPGTFWFPTLENPVGRFGTMVAAAMLLYVMGITRFARREAEAAPRLDVVSTTLGFNLGLLLLAMSHKFLPEWAARLALPPSDSPALSYYTAVGIWLAVVLVTNGMVWRALASTEPTKVQQAVKTCILAIIGIDAAVVALVCGPVWACGVLALLVPTIVLGRWVYST
jgi:4-hydroxybenzoate polyprenyltransferase